MSDRTANAFAVVLLVGGAYLILSVIMINFVDADFMTGLIFTIKMLVLCLVFAASLCLHAMSFKDESPSHFSDYYFYVYPVVISLGFMSWWPIIRFNNFPDVIDASRFLAWYQSYPFLVFCFLVLLLGLELLAHKTIQDWID